MTGVSLSEPSGRNKKASKFGNYKSNKIGRVNHV